MAEEEQPEQQEPELSVEDFERMAKELDTTGQATFPEPKPRQLKEGTANEAESQSATAEGEGVATPESQDGDTALKPEVAADKQSEASESEYSREHKEQARYERNWQKLNERSDDLRKREEVLAAKERELGSKAPSDPFRESAERDEKGYTVDEYERAIKKFRNDGEPEELVEKAEKSLQALRHQILSKAWQRNVDELFREDPKLRDPAYPLSAASNKVLEEIPVLKVVPDGAKHAVRIARAEMGSASMSGLKAKVAEQQKEIDRLTKLTSLDGSGVPLRVGTKGFDQLTMAEQESELRRLAEEADRQSVPF